MRTHITPEEISSYRNNGYVIIESFLDDAELAHWQEVITTAVGNRNSMVEHPTAIDYQALEEMSDEELAAMKESLGDQYDFGDLRSFAAYYERVFTQRVNLWQTDEKTRELILDPRIGKLAAELAGMEGVRLYHDQALFKPAWGNPTGFHLDTPYWSFDSPHAMSLWVALDDVDVQNGCLYFVPGTNRDQRTNNVVIGQQLGALFEVYPDWGEITPIAAQMKAGSASFHNGLTAHGAGANLTGKVRRAMTMQFMPVDAKYNGQPNVLPLDYVQSLTPGDALDNEDLNPLLFYEGS